MNLRNEDIRCCLPRFPIIISIMGGHCFDSFNGQLVFRVEMQKK